MALVRIADLLPDMVLDADVLADDCRLLARAGTVLTDRHVQILCKWASEEASIRGETVEHAPAPADPAVVARVEAQMGALFERANGDHPAMRELMELTRARLLHAAGTETSRAP